MNRCPITYELCGEKKYSDKGLTQLGVNKLEDFPYSAKEQVQLAIKLAAKLSIQGVQPKLSAVLNVSKGIFEVVEIGGRFIIKPPHHLYDELPQNEDVTMKMAKSVEIDVPLHGLMYNVDGSFSYFIKRFDRLPKGEKVAMEDFTQLLGFSRETKYEGSMEKVISVIEKHCTFPVVEKARLFRMVMFNFFVGNEDMHLKNFSLLRTDGGVKLSPSYDLLNSTIVLKGTEEMALPLKGKKSRFNRSDLLNYFGRERLNLPTSFLDQEMALFEKSFSKWQQLIEQSFLSLPMQKNYLELIQTRREQLVI